MTTPENNIDPTEARRRIDELAPVFQLANRYSRVERATVMQDGKPETDAEHAINLAMIATAYAIKYHPELDPYKVFFYCVMHDINEFLYGDTPTVGANAETFLRKEGEEAAAARERAKILEAFPGLNTMIDDLNDLTVAENAFGKAFDKLAPGYTHAESLGQVLKERYGIHSYEELLESVHSTDQKMLLYAALFVDILAMRAEMHVKVSGQSFSGPQWISEPLFDM